ncbi:glucose dehydrogenase [Fusarium albosuccineum]|uniref:Glucose dehydrogenase n=1 Tax=Fusarium albosuccineum TaxID=1237068 RepID=A0A8H4KXV5_9HYPO|nr:glucose dehydrogenase [Fusarium albosuccineum]
MAIANLDASLDLTKLAGKGVVITGGASGLGATMAKAFAQVGSFVTILDIQKDLGNSYAAELAKAFETARQFSPSHTIDVVIPSAAVFSEPFLDLKPPTAAGFPEPSTTVFDFDSSANAIEDPSPRLKSLIFMSSLGGYVAGARFSAYGASKFAVRGLWKSSRDDLKTLGVRSNLIAPWFIPTPMNQFQVKHLEGKVRFAKVEDVVDAALRCATDDQIQGMLRLPRSRTMSESEQAYDYVIIGGGTAGCVLASRLSKALPTASLLIIERGVAKDDRVLPALGFAPGFGSNIETNLRSVPQPAFEGITVSQTSGSIVGGSSAVNYETWTRGASVDFAQWAEVAGNSRWSWDGMLPYFRATETFIPSATHQGFPKGNGSLHGSSGPIIVSHPSDSGQPRNYPLREDMARFHEALGACLIPENNGGKTIGYTEVAQSSYNGERQFAAKDYTFGPNVTIWTESKVHHIDIENGRASSVTGIRHQLDTDVEENGPFRVRANDEVILSAGALFSPKLLMLRTSGIGPKEELESHGIPVKINLPVGKNLSDHPCVATKWTVNKKDASIGLGPMETEKCNWAAGPPTDWIAFHRANPSTLQVAHEHLREGEEKYYLSEEKAHWECFTMYGPFDTSEREIKIDPPPGESIVSVFSVLVTPLSRGSLTLQSSNPADHPIIDPALLASPIDKEILYDAIRSTTTAMKGLAGLDAVEYTIDEELRDDLSDTAIAARVKQGGSTVFHFSGTCAMGSVVDAECRVDGVTGLRVVDASVFPIPLAAHYQAATYALAEQVSDLILEAEPKSLQM